MTSDSADRSSKQSPNSALSSDSDEVSFSRDRYAIYECSECGNIAMTARASSAEMSCHGSTMDEITDWDIEVNTPELEEMLLDAFGLPKTGLEICLCVIGEGPLPASEAAEILGYDRSTTSRYLNDLVEMGLVEKTPLNREDGGIVNVYHSLNPDTMRRETLLGFYAWAGQAASMLEEANITKDEYLEGDYEEGLEEIFWRAMDDD